MEHFMANRLDEQYQSLLQDIIDFGVDKKDRTGTGCKSIFGYTIHHNMRNGFPLLTTKKVPFKTMATELMWFLKGDTNIKYLIDNGCNIWNGDAYKRYKDSRVGVSEPLSMDEFIEQIKTDGAFAEVWGDLGPIYGAQWRAWESNDLAGGTIDQIKHLIHQLKNNPDSRRLMVNAWNVDALEYMVLPPCHYGFQVYTRELSREERIENYNSKFENKIEVPFIKLNLGDAIENTIDMALSQVNIPTRAISLSWNQRSVDVFLGLPFNIASYGLLLEIIAKVVNMVPEHLVGHLGDTHLYNNHIEQAKEQISREPFELPTLNINTEFWQTESGECGVGPISTSGFISGLADDNFCKCLLEDIQLTNYQSHPTIKAPLSN
jgi:thymidylate synthase